jgi:hypothetical protein
VHYFKFLVVLMLILTPSYVYANGGAPILLYINFVAFVFGQVWILSCETYIYYKKLNIKPLVAFKQVFLVNLVSTLLVGLGLPLFLSLVTMFAMKLPNPVGGIFSIMGTWIYSSAPYIEYIFYITGIWFLITLFLTVLCERWYIKKLWVKSGFNPQVNVNSFMWQVHLVSYTGLIILFVFFVANGL